jgi:hypothetical protein
MSLSTGLRIFLMSLGVIASEMPLLFALVFQPGWANGWPGLSKHSVFAGFVTVMLFIALMSLATGLLALTASAVDHVVGRRYVGWALFAALLGPASIGVLVLCSHAFSVFREAIAQDWP